MITVINPCPENVAAFTASGEITKADFETIVKPRVTMVVEQFKELNYVFHLDTALQNFTVGAWFQDALLGVQHLSHWNRAAIVSDKRGVQIFTEIFSKLMPGEFRSFDKVELPTAIKWASTGK